jgi:6-bladed beta-propeller
MKIIIIILLLLSVIGCKRSEEERLQIIDTHARTIESANLSDVFVKVSMIKLQNTSPLIHIVPKIIKTAAFLFVADLQMEGGRILQFDHSGRFIKQIGKIGHGPGEYIYFYDFAVDTISKQVYIAALGQIIAYNFDGTYIKSQPMAEETSGPFLVNFMTFLNNELWVIQHRMIPPGESKNKWTYLGELIRYNKDLMKVDSSVIFRAFLNRNQMSALSPGSTYCVSNCGEKTYLYYPISDAEPLLRDTLYEFDGINKIPVLKLDFSQITSVDKTINPDAMDPNESLDAIYKIRNLMITSIYRTKGYVFAEYLNIMDPFLFCYDFNQKKGHHMKEGFTDDLFQTGIARIRPSDLNKGEFYFTKDGFELENTTDGIGESSNPVVFYINSKEI